MGNRKCWSIAFVVVSWWYFPGVQGWMTVSSSLLSQKKKGFHIMYSAKSDDDSVPTTIAPTSALAPIPPDTHFLEKEKKEENGSKRRRQMHLSWCGRDSCDGEAIREKVVGPYNSVEFEGPATGQVMCAWDDANGTQNSSASIPRVLILVKSNDEELLSIAAKAVSELVSTSSTTKIHVLLTPDIAAKLKYYFGVEESIQLFEPQAVPGFGGNHITDGEYIYFEDSDTTITATADPNGPDLICTLGGDGSLMYANKLFPGPCPPILCIAGGSLGFLTPFSKEDIVQAIRTSLGFITTTNNNDTTTSETQVNGSNTLKESSSEEQLTILQEEKDEEDNIPITLTGGSALPKYKNGGPICISMRMRLDCRVINREGVVRARFNVLNEVVIDRGASPYLANLECFCDNVHLTTVQADGIIFAT